VVRLNAHAARRLAVLFAVLLGGCAGIVSQPQSGGSETARCEQVFTLIDQAVSSGAAVDAMASRVPGFSYLRVDRFLQSFAAEPLAGAGFETWAGRMRALDALARGIELSNLPAAARDELERVVQGPDGAVQLEKLVGRCGAALAARDLADPVRRAELRELARMPDEYQDWKRVLGLYVLTRIPFAAGVRDAERSTAQIFALDPERLPVSGNLIRYVPPATGLAPAAIAGLFAGARRDALGIPEFNAAELDALFAAFAPLLEIDTASDDDRIGAVRLVEGDLPGIDLTGALVYRRIAYTRYRGSVLAQLVYSFWFPARPADSAFDLLAGRLDGITWRVTLTPAGEPWVYDAMHNCGCYHFFVPTARAVLLPRADSLDEQAHVPQRLGAVQAGERITLRIAARSHFIQRALPGAVRGAGISYAFADDDTLRSLPSAGGRRSLFGADGMVAATERGERFLFWPMGIPNPGAMRQWGRHATAFVGRRHFDDPHLFEKYFRDPIQ